MTALPCAFFSTVTAGGQMSQHNLPYHKNHRMQELGNAVI